MSKVMRWFWSGVFALLGWLEADELRERLINRLVIKLSGELLKVWQIEPRTMENLLNQAQKNYTAAVSLFNNKLNLYLLSGEFSRGNIPSELTSDEKEKVYSAQATLDTVMWLMDYSPVLFKPAGEMTQFTSGD